MKYRIKQFDLVADLHFLEKHLFLCFWKKVGFGSTSKLEKIIAAELAKKKEVE